MSWKYIAGFLDGDGCIYVPPTSNAAVRVEFSQKAEADLVLYQIELFLEKHGISSKAYQTMSAGGNEQTTLKVFKSADALKCLKCLLPYLVVKQGKALEGIKFLTERAQKPRATETHCKRGHLWSENEYWYRDVRQCRACKTLIVQQGRAKRKAGG
jgi:LAGLIDADG-like domain